MAQHIRTDEKEHIDAKNDTVSKNEGQAKRATYLLAFFKFQKQQTKRAKKRREIIAFEEEKDIHKCIKYLYA